MQLTEQSTETFVRRLAAASKGELEACVQQLKAIQTDPGETIHARDVAKDLAKTARARLRAAFQ